MGSIPLFGSEHHLPESVGGLALVGVENYQDPELGVSIRYGTPTTAKADVYLYDLGRTEIPEDLRSPLVVESFQGACQDVMTAAEHGWYRDFEVIKSQYLHLPLDAPAPFCLWAAFAYRQVTGPDSPVIRFAGRRVSHVAVRTDRGYINKVRYTYPEDAREDGFVGFLAFLLAWTGFVQMAPGRPRQ